LYIMASCIPLPDFRELHIPDFELVPIYTHDREKKSFLKF
jgi:hypothetical protein